LFSQKLPYFRGGFLSRHFTCLAACFHDFYPHFSGGKFFSYHNSFLLPYVLYVFIFLYFLERGPFPAVGITHDSAV
jgi:hypothetical protein